MLMALVAFLVLVVCLTVFGFFYLQLRRNKRLQTAQPRFKDRSSWGTCARCQQHRIIVNKEGGLCASCWSSINTKQLG